MPRRSPASSTVPAAAVPTVHTLANGVRVAVEPVAGVQSVAAGVWVDTGSRDETAAEAGLTHFIEHMVFKGTARRRAHHIASRMESVGGYLNAFTSKEHTCYYARGLAEHAFRALDTVADLVVAPAFPAGEIPKEQEVVVEELKMYEDQPEDLIFDRIETLVYGDHPLGRPIIGTEETVRSFDRATLVDFLGRHYGPERLVVTVAGNVQPARVVKTVERMLGSLEPRPRGERTPPPAFVPGRHEERRAVQQAHLALSTRVFDIHHPDRTVLGVLNTILGGGMSSLLAQNVREKYGYCYTIYSFVNHYHDAGDFGVYVALDEAKLAHAERLIFREIERLASAPVSPQRLRQAKAQVKGGMLLGLENLSSRMNRLGRQVLTFGRVLPVEAMAAEVDAVTAEDVQRLARDLADPARYARATILPDGTAPARAAGDAFDDDED